MGRCLCEIPSVSSSSNVPYMSVSVACAYVFDRWWCSNTMRQCFLNAVNNTAILWYLKCDVNGWRRWGCQRVGVLPNWRWVRRDSFAVRSPFSGWYVRNLHVLNSGKLSWEEYILNLKVASYARSFSGWTTFSVLLDNQCTCTHRIRVYDKYV